MWNSFIRNICFPALRHKPKRCGSFQYDYGPASSCSSPFSTSSRQRGKLPQHAEIAICGSELMGNSVAYHLTKSGVKDIVILQLPGHTLNFDRTPLTTTGGHISLFKSHYEEEVIQKSIRLYKQLQEECGFDVGFYVNGGLYVAQDEEMMIAFQRRVDIIKATSDVKLEILTPNEIKQRFPLVHTEDVKGGLFINGDAVANPHLVIKALQSYAVSNGAKIVPDCSFQKVLVKNTRVVGVETADGIIKCEKFVNCAGWFSWEYGQKQDPPVRIPCHPVERHYLKTKPIPSTLKEKWPQTFPTIFDMNAYTFLTRLKDDSFIIGAYEKWANPLFTQGVPKNWVVEMNPDFDHFSPILNAALNRLPLLKELQVDKLMCEPDTFSPDGVWIIGETAEIKNYYVAAATNGNTIQFSGGMGEYLAQWIINGERHAPLLRFDVQSFVDVHNCRYFLRDRVSEVVGKQLQVYYPDVSQYSTARNIRCSPLYSSLLHDGAVYGEFMCFEVPLHFSETVLNNDRARVPETTWRKPPYFDQLKLEHAAIQNGVGVFDTTFFSKFTISSSQNQVVDYLQKLCSNNIDIPIGHLIPTGMQNTRGGFEVDCIVGREDVNKYFIWSTVEQQTRIPCWLNKFLPSDNSVSFQDITSKFCLLELSGPKCMNIVNELAHRDMTMPLYRFKIVNFAYAPDVWILSFCTAATHGLTLGIPMEYARHVYTQIMAVGKQYGIINYGLFTQRSIRLEKYVGFWGTEVHGGCTPVEVGRMNRVDMTKDFIGKKPIEEQLQHGVKQRLTHFSLRPDDFDIDRDILPWKGEPIYRNGQFVGQCTTAAYAYSSKKMKAVAFICNSNQQTGSMDFVTKDYIMDKDALYQIVIAGHRYKIYPSLLLKAQAK